MFRLKHIIFVSIISLSLVSKIAGQPYIYLNQNVIDTVEGRLAYDIQKLDLNTNATSLFLSYAGLVDIMNLDPSQTWLIVGNYMSPNFIINCSDTTNKFYLPGDITGVGAFLYSENSDIVFIVSALWNSEKAAISVIDISTQERIHFEYIPYRPEKYNVLNEEVFFSHNKDHIYFFQKDSLSGDSKVMKFSTSSYEIEEMGNLSDLGYPNADGYILHKGRDGKGIIKSFFRNETHDTYCRIVDFDSDSSSIFINSQGYYNPHLLGQGEYLVLEEIISDITKSRSYSSGKLEFYNTNTGTLVKTIQLESKGKVYVFDNYPDNLYYYYPSTNQSINIHVSQLEQESISTYSVFATHSIWLKQNSEILSGSVGVNEAGEGPFLASQLELTVGIGTTTPAGYTIKGNRIKVKQNATANVDVYYNELTNNGTITGSLNTPLELPLFTTLPEFHTSTPGTENIVVPQNGEHTLLPGAYGEIQVKKNGKLIFTGGEYHINNINGGINNQLLFQGESEVRIKDKFETEQGSYIGPQDTTTISADEIVFYVEGINGNNGNLGATPKAAKVGLNNIVKANFYVPNGTIWLRQNSEVEGAFIGKDVIVGLSVKVKLNSAW